MSKLVCLDLACGNNKAKGMIGVDIVKTKDTDVVWDLNIFPWPWEDESVDNIRVQHFVEHLDDLIPFIEECYRILRVGGTIDITAPFYMNRRAWSDPTHKRAITEDTFLYFNKAWRVFNDLDHYPIKSDFEVYSIHGLNEEWGKLWPSMSEDQRVYATRSLWNVIDDIVIEMTKRKIVEKPQEL